MKSASIRNGWLNRAAQMERTEKPARWPDIAAMLRYGINYIRLFYENDVRFLKQF
jgi:hypothetical protein